MGIVGSSLRVFVISLLQLAQAMYAEIPQKGIKKAFFAHTRKALLDV
jgi:hypothetical protein